MQNLVLPSYSPAGRHYGVFDFFADDDYIWFLCFGSVPNLAQFSKTKVVRLFTKHKKKTVPDGVHNRTKCSGHGSECFDPGRDNVYLSDTQFAQTDRHSFMLTHTVTECDSRNNVYVWHACSSKISFEIYLIM